MLDPTPTIVVAPGLGVVAAGRDAHTARTASECYRRAIAIMRDAEAVDRFQPLTEAEAFQVEYWPLERYKLSLQPRAGELAGRVAFITGGASGIGAGLARRFAAAGAQVVVADINQESAASLCGELASSYGEGVALAVRTDVTSEADSATGHVADRAGVRRAGHPGVQRRRGLLQAHPGDLPGRLVPHPGHPDHRLFPHVPGGQFG